jgi:PAS domain S-box-containing protein
LGQRVIAVSATVLMVLGNAGFGRREVSATLVSLALMVGVLLIIAFVPANRRGWRAAGLAVSLLLMLLHGVNLLGLQTGVSLLAEEGAVALSAVTSVALLALNLALVLACGVRTWIYRDFLGETPGREDFTPLLVRRQRQRAMLVFGLIVGLVATAGYAYLRRNISQMRAGVATTLTEVAEHKVAQIEAWRRERLADARTLVRMPRLAENRPELAAYLEEYRRSYGYRAVILFDRTGAPVLASPAEAGAQEPVPAALIVDAAQAPDVLVEDLHRLADGTVGMNFIAPLRSAEGAFAGAILLRADARTHLYPILENWPVSSDSAETFLTRREGLSVVFLSSLRFSPKAALDLRFPLGQPGLPAAKAVIERRVDLGEGIDYRGVPVLWLARPISESSWVLLAKMDQAEAYGALRTEAWKMAGGFGLGLLAVGLLVGNYWRNRQRYYEQKHQDTERERQAATERLALVMRHANDVILLFDEDMRVVDANERALALYGRTPQEMRQLKAQDLRAEQTKGEVERNFAQALTADGLTFETEHQRKDGTVFPVEVSSRGVEIEGRRHVLSIVRDITERRRLTEALARQEARFRFVFDHMPVGISLSSPAGIELVNPAHARITGVTTAASRDHDVFARATLPEDYARQSAAAEQFLQGTADHYTVEKRYRHPDGTLQWAELTSRRFIDPFTGEGKVVTTLIDLAERKAHEQEIERLNRVYFVISQVNQALVRVKSRDELFREVCRVLVEIGRFRIAWVGWLNPETKLIDPVAVAGRPFGRAGPACATTSLPTRSPHRGANARRAAVSSRPLPFRCAARAGSSACSPFTPRKRISLRRGKSNSWRRRPGMFPLPSTCSPARRSGGRRRNTCGRARNA